MGKFSLLNKKQAIFTVSLYLGLNIFRIITPMAVTFGENRQN